jgi:integrase
MPSPHPTGSIYQRRADGRWCVAIRLPSGKRITKYARSERDARSLLRQLTHQQAAGQLQPPATLTLQQWLERWQTQKAPDWRPSTRARAAQALAPITAEAGRVRLDRLSSAALAEAFARLRGRCGSRTLQLAHVWLHAALADAVRQQVIVANPLDGVAKPRHQPRERLAWTLDDIRRLLDAAYQSPRPYAPVIALGLLTGLRQGELLGLRWSDVDLQAGTLAVRRNAVWIAGTSLAVGAPKSWAGQRVIPLSVRALAVLRRLPRPLDPAQPVFASRAGGTPRPQVLRRTLRALCAEAGIVPVGMHDLRRMWVSVLVASGADVKVTQALAGHSSVAVTLGAYARVLGGREREAIARLDQAVG